MGTVVPSDWEAEAWQLLTRHEHQFAGRSWRFGGGKRLGEKTACVDQSTRAPVHISSIDYNRDGDDG